ncbi:MAG: tetratricopeptide repeat protein [Thermodesulfobacteriota bacterium]|nr:tetratricopeptide repeat protein [Thermodesulfobacteriota bacterium]
MKNARVTISAFLIISILMIYAQTGGFSFVGFDDPQLIVENPHVAAGFTLEGVRWALGTAWHEHVFFYPLSMLSHMAAVSVFGLNPAGHHLVNVGLHATMVLLVFFFLCRMTHAEWRPALVAMLVAVHPMNVDSVAWVAQRSTLLCGALWMAVLLCYLAYIGRKKRVWYGAAFGIFILAVLAKSSAVMVPVLLLMIDGYRGRLTAVTPGGFNIKEKLPFFAVAAGWSLVVMITAKQSGAAASFADVTVWSRVANAITAYGVYPLRMVWPAGLSVYYPFPDTTPLWQPVLSGLFIFGVTLLLVRHARKMPMVLFGWLWYLVTLIPMLGFVQAGPWPATADHYMYMPGIGLFICLAWAIPEIQGHGIAVRNMAGTVIAVGIAVLAALSFYHARYYRNSIALFERAVRVTEDNFFAHINLGTAYAQKGNFTKAGTQFEVALGLQPHSPGAHTNLGNIDKQAGRFEAARAHYRAALQQAPDFVPALTGMADVLAVTGEIDRAIGHYRRAIAVDKQSVSARYNLGMVLASQNRLIEAYYQVRRALDHAPANADIHCSLAEIAMTMGRTDEAKHHFKAALLLDSSLERAQKGLARLRQMP